MINEVVLGDCFEGMEKIPDNSIDIILCDLPYGSTANKWDTVLDFEKLWSEYKRITKENAAIVLFSAQPFTTDLINSNRKMFRYDLIWEKSHPVGFLQANKMPLRSHEIILLFYNKLPTYNPQKTINKIEMGKERINKANRTSHNYRKLKNDHLSIDDGLRFPRSVQKFQSNQKGLINGLQNHPTQKPLELIEWLIMTYSNEKDLVLDNCMGSWTTARGAKNLNRDFIGFEISKEYCEIGEKRLEQNILF